MRPPPWIVRRLVLAPVALVIAATVVALSPVLIGLAAAIDLIVARRRLATVRLVAFVAVYALCEIAGLIALFLLWIAAGLGRRIDSPAMRAAHYGVMRVLLG